MSTVVRNDKNEPFSKWKPAEKFKHVLKRIYPDVWKACTPEHEFTAENRWRLDFAWQEQRVAVEIDGFGFGHQAQQEMAADNEKANHAVLRGWRILRFNSRQLGSIDGVEQAVEQTAEMVICGPREF